MIRGRDLRIFCVASALVPMSIGCRAEDVSRKSEHVENTRRVSEEDDVELRELTQPTAKPRPRASTPRFEMVPGETSTTFAARADAALESVERELMTLDGKNAALRNAELADEIADARKAAIEARKKLEPVRTGKGGTDDDRRTVVSAVERAQAELEEAREELVQTPGAM